MNRNEIKELLQMGVAVVKFTKIDGTERIMRCTLNPNFLPKGQEESAENQRKRSESTIAAWDVDIKDWRSFRLDSVQYATLSSAF